MSCRVFEWFETSYKKSPTYRKATSFVEEENLFGPCGSTVVTNRNWRKSITQLVRPVTSLDSFGA